MVSSYSGSNARNIVGDKEYATGQGDTNKAAKEAAAKETLRQLGLA